MAVQLKQLWEKAGFRSRDALAKRVHEQVGAPPKPSYRSIGIKLGELEHGKPGWWRTREQFARALAEVLDVDLDDLQLGGPRSAAAVPFVDFPQLRSFDARHEDPCPLGNESWFMPLGPQSRWIQAPPGTGRSFTASFHQQRHGARLVHVATLVDALPHAEEPGPLVIEVEQADERDGAVEQQLLTRRQVLVLAPFACWTDRHPMSIRPGAEPVQSDEEWPEWQRMGWRPRSDWRRRFIEWLTGRVPGGVRFNLQELFGWLEQEDVRGQLFATPVDLVALCAFAHEVGPKAWKRRARGGFTEWWLDTRFEREGRTTSPRDLWLRQRGREAVRVLVERWFQTSEPWLGALTEEHWIELLPEQPSLSNLEAMQRQVGELVKLGSKRERARKGTELLSALGASDKKGAFQALASVGIFQALGHGLWRFRFAWLANLMAKEYVERALRTQEPMQWGRWSVELARRELLDTLLDELTLEELLALTQRTVSTFKDSSLGAVGAVESLFAAIGYRLSQGERIDADSVLPLWRLQVGLLVPRDMFGTPMSLTRPGPMDGVAESQLWLEACWSWCLHVEGPGSLQAELEWLFPAWTEPSLKRAPDWLLQLPGSKSSYALGARIVGRCVDEDLPEMIPDCLLPGCILAAERRGWAPSIQHLQELMGNAEALTWLLEECDREAPTVRVPLAGMLWRACHEGRYNFYAQVAPGTGVRPFIDEHLSPEDFRALLSKEKLVEFAKGISKLPQRLQYIVVEEVMTRPFTGSLPPGLGDLLSQLRRLDAVALEELLRHLPHSHTVMKYLWQQRPARALELVREEMERGTALSESWFLEAPLEHFSALLECLESSSSPLPDWAWKWLAQRFLRVPALAERVHALMMRGRPSSS